MKGERDYVNFLKSFYEAAKNLNDEDSKALKLNGLKMLNSLLNNNKNLDEFLNAHRKEKEKEKEKDIDIEYICVV